MVEKNYTVSLTLINIKAINEEEAEREFWTQAIEDKGALYLKILESNEEVE